MTKHDPNAMSNLTLDDLVREAGGWPIDMEAVLELLENADHLLFDGRHHKTLLSVTEVHQLGFLC